MSRDDLSRSEVTTCLRIALVGSPNSGKTTLFNALTGLKHRVGNFAGVTVEYGRGNFRLADGCLAELIDLPGINSLTPSSSDEAVTIDLLLAADPPIQVDQIWIVGDLENAKRTLLLAQQVRDLGYPCVVVFNRLDYASEVASDALCQAIESKWNVPAVAVSARFSTRIDTLRSVALKAKASPQAEAYFTPTQWTSLTALDSKNWPYRTYRRLLLMPEPHLPVGFETGKARDWLDRELALRLDQLEHQFGELIETVQRSTSPAQRRTRQLDRWFLHPVWGPLALVVCLLLVFQVLFTLSEAPMNWVDHGMAQAANWMRDWLPDAWWSRLLIDGLWTGLQGVFVFIPQIALLFALVALLEESGYMARLVGWLDRPMQRLGLAGKSAPALLGGFACAVPSIMLTRSLTNRRQRLLTILLVPFMSCSARLPVYVVLIAVLIPEPQSVLGLDLRAWCLAGAYLAGPLIGILFIQLIALGLGPRPRLQLLVTELPTYRLPTLRDVLTTVWNRSRVFVQEAGRVIVVVSIILWFLAQHGPADRRNILEAQQTAELVAAAGDSVRLAELNLQHEAQRLQTSWAGVIGRAFEPLIEPLGYDWRIGVALLTSFAAREVFVATMNTLFAVGGNPDDEYDRLTQRLQQARHADTGEPLFSIATVVSLLLFYAIALQCMSTVAVMRRELGGWKLTLLALGWHTALAWLAAFAAWQLLS